MARMRFGGGPEDVFLFADEEGDMHAGGGFNVLFYDGPTVGATAITDLLNASGGAITYITTSDGTDGHAVGQIPPFFGPDGVFEMWMSIDGGPRQVISCNNVGSYYSSVKTQVDALLNSGNPNPTNMTLSSLIGIDGASLDAAPVGSTLVKQSDGEYGAGGAPVPLANMVWVAAVDAPPAFVSAQYLCDGINDEVQIQQALNNALGLRVGLSPGTFQIASTVYLEGPDNATQLRSRYLIGSGTTATKLVVASGAFAGVELNKGVSGHVWDMTIQISGGARGIYTTPTTTSGANYTSAINSSIRRVAVIGPGDGTTSSYAIGARSAMHLTVEDVSITGVNFGLLIRNDQGAHMTNGIAIRRCAVSVTGNNSIAYRIDADAGSTRAVTVQDCSASTDLVYTGTTAFHMSPVGEVSGVRLMACVARNFGTTLNIGASAYEVQADFAYVSPKSAGTISLVSGFANQINIAELDTSTNASNVIMNDTNVNDLLPNEYQHHVNSSTTTTLTGTLGVGVVLRGVIEGPATLPAALTRNPSSFIDRAAITPVKVTNPGTTGPNFTNATLVVRTALEGKLVYARLQIQNTVAMTATNDNITDQLAFTVNTEYRPPEDVNSVWSSGVNTGEAGFNPSGQIYFRTSDQTVAINSTLVVDFIFMKD
jgi:hypothetical protein